MTPDELAQDLANAIMRGEAEASDLQRSFLQIGKKMHEFQKSAAVSNYKAAQGKAALGRVHGSIGNTMAAIAALHAELTAFDPRPQTRDGGGK